MFASQYQNMFCLHSGNDYLCRNKQQTMKKTLLLILTSLVLFACQKEDQQKEENGLGPVIQEYTCECGAMYYVTCMNPVAIQPGEAPSSGDYWVPVEESFWWNEWNVEIVENGDKVFFPYYENTTHTRMYFECSCGRTKQYCSSDFYTQPTPTPHIIPQI